LIQEEQRSDATHSHDDAGRALPKSPEPPKATIASAGVIVSVGADTSEGPLTSWGQTPRFECTICRKCFDDSANYKRHTEIHDPNTATKYECAVCFRGFRRKGNLQVQ